jgi:hypothetical protein
MADVELHARSPEHHRNDSSKEVLKLVLGLPISSAKSSYDAQEAEVQQLGIHLF